MKLTVQRIAPLLAVVGLSAGPASQGLERRSGGSPASLPPDVVLVLIDDVADTDIDVVSQRGWLPNLDNLAARGMRFHRAYAHAKCHPTRDSLHFGRWLGLDRGDACAPAVPGLTHELSDLSLVELFEGQGYNTLFVGKWHTGTATIGPFELAAELFGYDSVRQLVPVGPECSALSPGSEQFRIDDGVGASFANDNTVALRDAFLQWWTETPSPRFATINFGAAHEPFAYPAQELLPRGYPPCGLLNCTNRKEYEAEIVGVDTAMGDIMAAVGPSAYLIFLGDNGTPGNVPHKPPSITNATRPDQDPDRVKLSAYEDGVRVPLIVAGPKVLHGTSDSLVHVVDVMPTLLQITGSRSKLDERIQGRSFARCLLGLPGPRNHVFVWDSATPAMALIESRWKLLTRLDGVEELYDLTLDPREQAPLPLAGPDYDRLRLT